MKEQHSNYYGPNSSKSHHAFWWTCEVAGCGEDFLSERAVHNHMSKRHQGHTYVIKGKRWGNTTYVRQAAAQQVDDDQEVDAGED